MRALVYGTLVYAHVMLVILWLGAGIAGLLLNRQLQMRLAAPPDQRRLILKLYAAVDVLPRVAWALMGPFGFAIARAGGWALIPISAILFTSAVSAFWLFLIWNESRDDRPERAASSRDQELWLKVGLALAYIALGSWALTFNTPVPFAWLAWKIVLLGLIFAAAIMAEVTFGRIAPQIGQAAREGPDGQSGRPLTRGLVMTRSWMICAYGLLAIAAWLGVAKPGSP